MNRVINSLVFSLALISGSAHANLVNRNDGIWYNDTEMLHFDYSYQPIDPRYYDDGLERWINKMYVTIYWDGQSYPVSFDSTKFRILTNVFTREEYAMVGSIVYAYDRSYRLVSIEDRRVNTLFTLRSIQSYWEVIPTPIPLSLVLLASGLLVFLVVGSKPAVSNVRQLLSLRSAAAGLST